MSQPQEPTGIDATRPSHLPDPDSPEKLLVISFEDVLRAQEFMIAAQRLQTKGDWQLHDAVLVIREEGGHSRVVETTDVTPARGALGGGFWGLLFGTLLGGPIGGLIAGAAGAGGGALMAQLVDTGIKDETIAELRTAVPAGRTAVALLVSRVDIADLQVELTRFPSATLIETTLPPAAVAAVQNALVEANRPPFAG